MMEELIPIAYFLGILLTLNIFSFLFYKYTNLVKPKLNRPDFIGE